MEILFRWKFTLVDGEIQFFRNSNKVVVENLYLERAFQIEGWFCFGGFRSFRFWVQKFSFALSFFFFSFQLQDKFREHFCLLLRSFGKKYKIIIGIPQWFKRKIIAAFIVVFFLCFKNSWVKLLILNSKKNLTNKSKWLFLFQFFFYFKYFVI